MLKNALSLNRLANIFHILSKQTKKYDESWPKEQKIQNLKNLIRLTTVAIGAIDMKVKLKGISRDFVAEAREIKTNENKDQKGWLGYLNVLEWFK
jgi:hypothetical protein